MREIRFRAWYKPEGYMLSGDEMQTGIESSLNDYFIDDDYVFMQYTGLKDANGVMIFEGDICKITEPDDDSCCGREFEYIGGVIWGNGKWKFKDNVYRCLGAPDWTKHSNLGDWVADFEVIGNIHQHPQLLEQQ